MLLLMFNQFLLMIFQILLLQSFVTYAFSVFEFTTYSDSFGFFSSLKSLFINFFHHNLPNGCLLFAWLCVCVCVFFCYCLLLKGFVSIVSCLIFLWCWNYLFCVCVCLFLIFYRESGVKCKNQSKPQQRVKLNDCHIIKVLG